jgi:hypothetical protein
MGRQRRRHAGGSFNSCGKFRRVGGGKRDDRHGWIEMLFIGHMVGNGHAHSRVRIEQIAMLAKHPFHGGGHCLFAGAGS